jgi:hypothetical protein
MQGKRSGGSRETPSPSGTGFQPVSGQTTGKMPVPLSSGLPAGHTPIHDPGPTGLAELLLDLGHYGLDGLQILRVSSQGAVPQGKTASCHDQGQRAAILG